MVSPLSADFWSLSVFNSCQLIRLFNFLLDNIGALKSLVSCFMEYQEPFEHWPFNIGTSWNRRARLPFTPLGIQPPSASSFMWSRAWTERLVLWVLRLLIVAWGLFPLLLEKPLITPYTTLADNPDAKTLWNTAYGTSHLGAPFSYYSCNPAFGTKYTFP